MTELMQVLRFHDWRLIDVEDAVVASLLLKPEELIDRAISMGVCQEAFEGELHRRVWASIEQILKEGGVFDQVVLFDRWHEEDPEQCQRDFPELSRIVDRVEVVSHFSTWVEMLLGNYRRALMEKTFEQCGAMAQQEPEEAKILLKQRLLEVEQIGAKTGQDDVDQVIDSLLAKSEEQFHRRKLESLIRTPFVEWDEKFSPIAAHELVVVAARPSVGKSSFAVKTAWLNVDAGKRVVLFSAEMNAEQVISWIAAQKCQVNLVQLWDEPWARFRDYQHTLDKLRGPLKDRLLISRIDKVEAMEVALREIRTSQGPIDLVVVDYIQLLEIDTGIKENRTAQIAAISRRLKKWTAPEVFGCPVIALSQLSRDLEKERRPPRLSDLKWSGEIEQDADRVVFIHRPDTDRAGQSQIHNHVQDYQFVQAKNRMAPIDKIEVEFVRRTTSFRSVGQSLVAAEPSQEEFF